jgi:surface protein
MISVDDTKHSSDGLEGVGASDMASRANDAETGTTPRASAAETDTSFEEKNFYFMHWLYRIRKANCARGLRIGFLQPDFLCILYGPMMRSEKLRRTNNDIKVAVNLWCSNRAHAEEQYGHISEWDVSSVTDMSQLFQHKNTFNDDISRWDVSNVINTSGMFACATSFSRSLGDWDVSSVTDSNHMFFGALSFNAAIGDWDVSNVTNMNYMFCNVRAFNAPIGNWNVSKVVMMEGMFRDARKFNQDVGNWDVSKVSNMSDMFRDAHFFNQDLTRWDIRAVTCKSRMFMDAFTMLRENKPARAARAAIATNTNV